MNNTEYTECKYLIYIPSVGESGFVLSGNVAAVKIVFMGNCCKNIGSVAELFTALEKK